MKGELYFFMRGIKRLALFAVVVLLFATMMNILGYWITELDLEYALSADCMQDSYIGRALNLALVGVMNLVYFACAAVIVYGVGALIYLFILAVGGYSFTDNHRSS